MKPIFTSDEKARVAMKEGGIEFSLDPIFTVSGGVDAKLVMRYPLAMRISCYTFDTEFLLGAYILGKALDIWHSIPKDPFGVGPQIYIPITMRVLSDYRFLELVSKNERLIEHASRFILMGTPDSASIFPDMLDVHGLAREYGRYGIQISVGEIQSQHIKVQIIQEGIESVLPAAKLERTPDLSSSMLELRELAGKMGVPLLTNQTTPWVITLDERSGADNPQPSPSKIVTPTSH